MPRKPRLKINRRPEIGTLNCSWGLFSKANALFRQYDADVVVIARRPGGGIGGYQSRPGLARDFLQINEQDLLGPQEVDPYMTQPSKGVSILRAMSSSGSSSATCPTSTGSESPPINIEETALDASPLSTGDSPDEGVLEEPLHHWAEFHDIRSTQTYASPETICPTSITGPAQVASGKKRTIRRLAPLSRIQRKEIVLLFRKFE